MKRLLVVLVVSALLIISFSSINKVSADLAPFPCTTNDTRSGLCGNPSNPVQTKCIGFIDCLNSKTIPTWGLYLINLGIETFVAAIFVILFKKSKRIILAVVIVNLISWPVLYTQTLHHGSVGFLFVAEAAVWLFERCV